MAVQRLPCSITVSSHKEPVAKAKSPSHERMVSERLATQICEVSEIPLTQQDTRATQEGALWRSVGRDVLTERQISFLHALYADF